jgi:hypothetical protein
VSVFYPPPLFNFILFLHCVSYSRVLIHLLHKPQFSLPENLRHVKSDRMLAFVSALAGDRPMDARTLQTHLMALAVSGTAVCELEADDAPSDGGDVLVKGVHLCQRHGQRVAIVAFWNWQDARRVKEIFDARLTGFMMGCEQVAADELTKVWYSCYPAVYVNEALKKFLSQHQASTGSLTRLWTRLMVGSTSRPFRCPQHKPPRVVSSKPRW